MAAIMVVDDEAPITRLISHVLANNGHVVECAHSLEDGLQRGEAAGCDVVILDVMLPDGNGLARVSDFMNLSSSPEVVVITGYAEHDGARIALESGVFDYVQKPFGKNDILLACTRALEFRNSRLAKPSLRLMHCHRIIGKSPGLRSCMDAAATASGGGHNILITGETGTGKELFARAVHENSPRASGSFVIVDCAALKSTLLEATLFGHEKGAFTGAGCRREGLVKQAHNGTLFLDEIGELNLGEQKKFLRLLEEKQYYPLGSKKTVRSDFRLVMATNRDLEAMAGKGEFRSDLLYRIRGQQIHLPPLRERKADLRDLVFHYTEKICARRNLAAKKIPPDFLEAISAYEWPGNVRELVNAIDGCISGFPEDPFLRTRHLPARIRVSIKDFDANGAWGENGGKAPVAGSLGGNPVMASQIPGASDEMPEWKVFRKHAMEVLENRYFSNLFFHTSGSVKEMARESGVSQARVYDLMKKHGIGRA